MLSGALILFVGPRGSGKTTAINELQKRFINLKKCITATTRSPRNDEKFGIHNYFVSREIFEWMVEGSQIIEYTDYLGELYGTPEFELDAKLKTSHVAIAIDIVGADTFQRLGYTPIIFFIRPPTSSVQIDRIKARSPELTDAEIDDQLQDTDKEYEWFRSHPVAIEIVNNTLESMIEEVASYLIDAKIDLIANR